MALDIATARILLKEKIAMDAHLDWKSQMAVAVNQPNFLIWISRYVNVSIQF